MALISCQTCNAQIAKEAKTCPQCGATNGEAFKAVRLGGLIYLALIGALFYWIWGIFTPGESATAQITRGELGEAWPFTVERLGLVCEPGDAVVVVDSDTGARYGVNGAANGRASALNLKPLDTIWRDNPAIPGTKVSVGPVIEQGLQLCK